MTHQNPNEERLKRLLEQAVSDVEPGDRLDQIRSATRTDRKVIAMPASSSRPWIWTALGAAAAVAVVLTGLNLLSGPDDQEPDPVDGTASPSVSETPSEPAPSTSNPPEGETVAVPVYYVADTAHGLRLYREFHSVVTADPPSAAVNEAVSAAPHDPDYRMPWPEGVAATASYNGDVLTVDLDATRTGNAATALRNRPPGMSQEQAQLAVEQVIYTAQAGLGQGRVPVQLLINGLHSDTVLGVPAAEPLANAPVLDVLSHVNITTPAENAVVSGDRLDVTGVANSFEANVLWTLDGDGGTDDGFFMAQGWMGAQLFPFEGTIDVAGLPPGDYVLTVRTDDPSGGAEGNGPHVDTKSITIE